jgi:hypothetical protein
VYIIAANVPYRYNSFFPCYIFLFFLGNCTNLFLYHVCKLVCLYTCHPRLQPSEMNIIIIWRWMIIFFVQCPEQEWYLHYSYSRRIHGYYRGMCQCFFVVVITFLQVSFCFWWPFSVSRSYWGELALLRGLNIPCFCRWLSVQFILAVVCYLQ